MNFQGVIFDFNGVLLWDNLIQEEAWNEMAVELRGTPLTDEEIHNVLHGRVNRDMLAYLSGKALSDEEIKALSNRKEQLYRDMCLEQKGKFKLSPGAVELLDFLVQNNIPHTIATASPKVNLDFFIENLNLGKWFDTSLIVYDDGHLPGKPAPDIYLKAASKLGLEPGECIVIEDAKSGIEAAFRAGIGKIIALGPKERHTTLSQLEGVTEVITNFGELNKEDLLRG